MGRNSIVFYAAHVPALFAAAYLIPPNSSWSGTVFFVLMLIWALVVGIVLQLLRERSAIFVSLFDFRPILKMAQARLSTSV